MARRGKVTGLPSEIKQWLDSALVDNNFSDYELLAAELRERGFDISKSALHRYGQEFEMRLAALKMASEQARAVVTAAPDEEGAVNEALMRLVQEHLFRLLMAEDGKFDLPKVARAVAELGRATVTQKKWQTEVRARLEAKLKSASDEAETIAKGAGMSDDTWSAIRAKFLGIKVDE